MKSSLPSWDRACARGPLLRFVDHNLRGLGQVMFQDNPFSGLLFLAAIAWGARAAGRLEVLAGAVLALVVGTLTAMWLRADARSLAAGLHGYNAALVGLALPTFLAPSPLLWGCVVLGAAVSVVCLLGAARVMHTWGLSPLTFPFVLITWLLLAAAYAFADVEGRALPPAQAVAAVQRADVGALAPADMLAGVLHSVSQVFLIGDGVAGLLFLAGLAVNSRWAAAFGLGGALLAVASAQALGAERQLVSAGLMGFSPVLTAIALGAAFPAPSARTLAYVALGTVFTVVVQGALNALFAPLGLPTLTAPFVLVTWLFLLPRRHVAATAEPADAI